jgi:hypothetical protein
LLPRPGEARRRKLFFLLFFLQQGTGPFVFTPGVKFSRILPGITASPTVFVCKL